MYLNMLWYNLMLNYSTNVLNNLFTLAVFHHFWKKKKSVFVNKVFTKKEESLRRDVFNQLAISTSFFHGSNRSLQQVFPLFC